MRNRLGAEVERHPRVFSERDEAAQRLSQAVQGLPLDAAKLLVQRGTTAVEGGYTWSTDTRLRTPSALRFTEEHVLSFLGAITAPSLLVLGDDGMRFPESTYSKRRETLPGLKVVKLSGGHHLHMENSSEVAETITSFLGGFMCP